MESLGVWIAECGVNRCGYECEYASPDNQVKQHSMSLCSNAYEELRKHNLFLFLRVNQKYLNQLMLPVTVPLSIGTPHLLTYLLCCLN